MLADIIVIALLLAVGVGAKLGTLSTLLPPRPDGALLARVGAQGWLPVLVLAVLLSLGGWTGRVALHGLTDTLQTAAGGPTAREFEACRAQYLHKRCPYGGERVDGQCSLHGAAR